jgi:PhnB protein
LSDQTISPLQIYLTVAGGNEAIAFYQKAFDAKEIMRQEAEDGKRLLHATLEIFGGHIMLSDEFPEHEKYVRAPGALNGTSVTVHVNLASPGEIDRAMGAAEKAGAEITMKAQRQMWGAYYGRLIDPFGHSWSFAADAEND